MQFATDDRVATSSMYVLLGDYAAVIMAVFIMISTFGCNLGLIIAGPKVLLCHGPETACSLRKLEK